MANILFHNPQAGGNGPSKDALLAAFDLVGLPVTYCSTKDGAFADMLRRPASLIIAAGGDGTVARILTQIPDRSVPVAILPLGSANNIARSLAIAGTPLELAELLRPDQWQQLDIGLASGPWGRRRFVEAVGLGPFAQAIHKCAADEIHGADKLRKGRATLCRMLERAGPLDADILIDGEPLNGDLLAVEIANIVYAGPALPVAPAARPGDGLLDIVSIESVHRNAMMSWIDAPHRHPLPVAARQARRIDIAWRGEALRLDDKLIDPPESGGSIAVALEQEPVKILVPRPRE